MLQPAYEFIRIREDQRGAEGSNTLH